MLFLINHVSHIDKNDAVQGNITRWNAGTHSVEIRDFNTKFSFKPSVIFPALGRRSYKNGHPELRSEIGFYWTAEPNGVNGGFVLEVKKESHKVGGNDTHTYPLSPVPRGYACAIYPMVEGTDKT